MCQSFWTSSGCCSVASSKILLSGLSVTMSVPKSYDSQGRTFVSSFLCSLGHDFSRLHRGLAQIVGRRDSGFGCLVEHCKHSTHKLHPQHPTICLRLGAVQVCIQQ